MTRKQEAGRNRPTAKRRALLSVVLRAGSIVLLLGIAPPLLAACNPSQRPSRPSYKPRERVPTLPIRLSDRERPNSITYYLASVTQKGPVVVVDMDLMNGHARGFHFVTVWITLVGTKGEKQQMSYAAGQVGPHETNHVIARAKNVMFQVETIDVGVQLR